MTRRYAFKTAEPLARDADLTLQMTPLTPAAGTTTVCTPSPTDLYWFSDLTGAFDQDVEAAYLLAEGAAGPLLGLARVLGETCDDVTWTTTWLPASGVGGEPGLIEDGANLIVYPLADTLPGILSVTALCAGLTFGPIFLTVLRYSCYSDYSYSSSDNLGWWQIVDYSGRISFSGYSNPIDPAISVTDVDILIASGTYPVGFYLYIRFPTYPAELIIDSFSCDSIQLISSNATSAWYAVVVGATPNPSTITLLYTDTESVSTPFNATITVS